MFSYSRVRASCKDPRPRGLRGLQEAFSQTLLDPWCQMTVGLPARHCDEQLGPVQTPFPLQERHDQVWTSIVG